jgi:quinoprotein glucose dehydrogenase
MIVDYDVAAQPLLFNGKTAPAVAINTKMGHLFVLNRLTGVPLLAVEERAVPQSDIPGEQSWPTQPFPTISLVPEGLTPGDAWGPTAEDAKWCRDKIKASRSEGVFTPPSLQGTIVFPGNVGGVNWGSAAYDPQRHTLVTNTNRWQPGSWIPREEFKPDNKQQDNRSTASSRSSPAHPMVSTAPSSFLQAGYLATLRRGVRRRLLISSLASRSGMFRSGRWFPASRQVQSTLEGPS